MNVRKISIPRTVFPGVSTTKYLRKIDLHISIDRDDTSETMQCIRQIAADVQGIVTLKIRLSSSRRPQHFHPLVAAVVETMKSLVAITHVKLNVKDFDTEGGDYWPSSHTRDLESSLGPNLSERSDELYFRSSTRPRDWGKLNVSSLLRLPINLREKIFFLVIGRVHDEEEEVNYPSRGGSPRLAKKRITVNVQNHIIFTGPHHITSTTQNHNEYLTPNQVMSAGPHRIMLTGRIPLTSHPLDRITIWPALAKVNPKLDISLAQTCHKFAEEALKMVFARNTIVFSFEYYNGIIRVTPFSLPVCVEDCVSKVLIRIQDLESITIKGMGTAFLELLKRLTPVHMTVHPGREDPLPFRTLHVEVKIHAKRALPEVSSGAELYKSYLGVDFQLARHLSYLVLWDRIIVSFVGKGSRDQWRRQATEVMTSYLGPNYYDKPDGMQLEFHPQDSLAEDYYKRGHCLPPVHIMNPFAGNSPTRMEDDNELEDGGRDGNDPEGVAKEMYLMKDINQQPKLDFFV